MRFAGAGHPTVENQLEKMTRAICRLHVRAGVCAPREALRGAGSSLRLVLVGAGCPECANILRYSARGSALFSAPFPVVCGIVEVRLVLPVVRFRSFASFIGSSLFRLCCEHVGTRSGFVRNSWRCRHLPFSILRQVIAVMNSARQSESNLQCAS